MRAVAIEQFPGLDLRRDPGEAVGALDALNVTLEPGWVRTRDGCSLLFTLGAAAASLHAFGPDLVVPCLGTPSNVYVVNSVGGAVGGGATLNTVGLEGASGVAIGTASGSFFYLVSKGSAVKRLDAGGTWTTPPPFPAGTAILALGATGNRLVACDGNSTVWFSDPGAPETFAATNFERLAPGDGEGITAAATYNNQLFVFKRTKFFVFYGESLDAAGEPIFNYRMVNTGAGVGVAAALGGIDSPVPNLVCSTPTGVYFLGGDGIYRTTGGAPEKISAAIDPVFKDGANNFWLGGQTDWSQGSHRLFWAGDCLYVAIATSSSAGMTLVWDSRLDAWTCWGVRSWGFAELVPDGTVTKRTLIWTNPANNTLLRRDPTLTSDNGAAIVSRYRTGFQSFGDPGEKKLTEAILEGSGTPTLQWSDDRGVLEAGAAVTLGVDPAFATGRRRFARRGRSFSAQLGASSGAWKVHRMQVNLTNRSRTPRVAR